MGRLFILIGAAFIAAGLLVTFWDRLGPLKDILSRIPFGRLPGDIAVEKENVRFYFPWVTCLVVSAVISLLLWLFRK